MINKMFGHILLIGLVLGCGTGCATKGSSGEVEVRPAPRPSGEVVQSARTNSWSTDWKPLFDGKSMRNWATTDFAGGIAAKVEKGAIQIEAGAELSGITWTNGSLPKTNYELALDAMKVQGSDFFCGLTFPVRNSFCSLILGGWGGSVVGLSSIDGMDASENETTKSLYFAPDKWCHVRVRVTDKKIETWLDNDLIIDVPIENREVAMRFGEIYKSKPLGIATYTTSSAVKNIQLRLVNP
ncbi:MAG: 3-keto-disaccharide hydrolase [Limisphaerales bacterium]